MADFIMFDAGANQVWNYGLPATCSFDLSTKSVASTNPFAASDTYAARSPTPGTSYTQKTEAEPAAAMRQVAFSQKSWSTGSDTDWSAACRSIVLSYAASSIMICAWNLQAGGVERDMSQPNTTENVTPTLGPLNNPS